MLFSVVGNYINHYFFQNDLIKVFSHEQQKIGRFLFINKTNHNREKDFCITLKNKPTSGHEQLNVTNTPIIIKDEVVARPVHKMCFTQKQVFFISMYNFLLCLICGKICESKLKKQYKMVKRCLLIYQDLLNLFKKIKDIEIMQKIFMKNQKSITDSIVKRNKEEEIYHRDESMIVSNLALSPIRINQQAKTTNKE